MSLETDKFSRRPLTWQPVLCNGTTKPCLGFNSANRCKMCGKHREPAFATGISALASDRERLSVEL